MKKTYSKEFKEGDWQVIFGYSAANRHNLAFYEAIKDDGVLKSSFNLSFRVKQEILRRYSSIDYCLPEEYECIKMKNSK